MTANPRKQIEAVRASRDGHEFHEAWTARKSMQLLRPDSEMTAIAVEGLAPVDESKATKQTSEIADLTIYYGSQSFRNATKTIITQFKYSIANKETAFRASNATKTIEKFANAYREYKKKYGTQLVRDKLRFQIITNRPVSHAFLAAIQAVGTQTPSKADVHRQVEQFQRASKLSGKPLAEFAQTLTVIGRTSNLTPAKRDLANLIVDWSSTSDTIANARLGQLRSLVRDKAGHAGSNNNLITRTDVLAALGVGDPEDLLPCQPAFPEVGAIVERQQLAEASDIISNLTRPLLIHAAGGIGKTVFMETLAANVARDHEVALFDCFAGGAYRSLEDSRHLPHVGLIHIANTLAFRGLCDPILPGNTNDTPTLFKTFRRRLCQCTQALSRMAPGRRLLLFIDAIDNAELVSKDRNEDCFPLALLQAFDSEPIPGVHLILSSRTERKPKGHDAYEQFQLAPFSKQETATFLMARVDIISQQEIDVAHARSRGNPRILDYLLTSDRGLLDNKSINKALELDDLIQERITSALRVARTRGNSDEDITSFLAGLAVLPPPIPLAECAGAYNIQESAIESFASDLAPLLENTKHGIMFRDEPTETLIHNRYS